MRGWAFGAVALAAAVVVGLGVGDVWLAGDAPTAREPAEAVVVRARVSPTLHAFGDPVVATVDVVVDVAEVDPATVALDTEFAPYEAAGAPTVERTSAGRTGIVRFAFPLRCLREGCDAAGARGVSEFPSGRVLYRFRSDRSAGRAVEALDWPAFEVASRVDEGELDRLRWRGGEGAIVPTTFRLSPTTAAAVLLGAAAALAALALLLARRLWRPAPAAAADGEEAEQLAPLARALVLVTAASGNGASPERQRALERAARELQAAGLRELADEARALAWSPRPVSGDELEGFAARALRAQAGGGA